MKLLTKTRKLAPLKIPVAPAHISRAINELAAIKATAKMLAAKAKIVSEPIIKNGSCHNERWRAYVYHVCAATRWSHIKPRDAVKLTPMPTSAA